MKTNKEGERLHISGTSGTEPEHLNDGDCWCWKETTPNNKFLDSPVNSIGLKLGDMILHNGEIIRDIPEVTDALNSVLEQERKDERQRVIDELRKINGWECGEDYPNSEDCYCESGRSIRLEDYINQLKEEV